MGDVIFLTESGHRVGHGHLTRCASIRGAFQEIGLDPRIWVAAHGMPESIQTGMEHVEWYSIEKYEDDLRKASMLLIDSYLVSEPQLRNLASIQSNIAVIDDYHRRSYTSGVVIDWTIGSECYSHRDRQPNVMYLLGSRYCALRSEFSVYPVRSYGDQIRSVLITFGGTDIRHLTWPVLQALQERYPVLEKHVVIGSGFRDSPNLELFNDGHTHFYRECDAECMSRLMAACDAAICGGGQTLYEVASQGLPPIVVCLIDNQMDDIKGFSQIGFATFVGWWNDPEVTDAVLGGMERLMSGERRQACAASVLPHLDGQGTSRLVAALVKRFNLDAALSVNPR